MGKKRELLKRKWMPYHLARLLAQEEKIRTKNEYVKWHKKINPRMIPRYPYRVYLDDWVSWNHFLNNRNVYQPYSKKIYWTYQESMKWCHKQGWKQANDFYKARREKKLPEGMPKWPDNYYYDRGQWQGWTIFLGKTAKERIEIATLDIGILAICIPLGMPGGYIVPIISDTQYNYRTIMEARVDLKPIKLYHWEQALKPYFNRVLTVFGSLQNSKENLWLIGNINDIISNLDQAFQWYIPPTT